MKQTGHEGVSFDAFRKARVFRFEGVGFTFGAHAVRRKNDVGRMGYKKCDENKDGLLVKDEFRDHIIRMRDNYL